MSLLGIDVGITRCVATAFSLEGAPLAQSRQAYDIVAGPGGMLELDSRSVWNAVSRAIHEVVSRTKQDPIRALSVSSTGETMAPLSAEGRILGNCIVGPDDRIAHYAQDVKRSLGDQRLFDITGNVAVGPYSLASLCWLRENEPRLFASAWRFLPLGPLVCHLLGGTATCDYSLASRTLLFDLGRKDWSRELLQACNLSRQKLPGLAPAGTPVGTVSPTRAQQLGLHPRVRLVLGGHDQCCRALGSGVTRNGMAVFGLASQVSVTPAFHAIPLTSLMLSRGLTMEHHLVPGLLVGFFYDRSGGSILRWFAETLAPLERRQAHKRGVSVYDVLLAEMPEQPTRLMVLPHFAPTGPPHFDARASGAILGLDTGTTRGEIVKAFLEGVTYHCAEGQMLFEEAGIRIQVYRAMGGGSRSNSWLQLGADILGVPVERTQVVDPATLGAAMLAGVGCGVYAGFEEAVEAAVHVERAFLPDPQRQAAFQVKMERYAELYPLLRDYLHRLHDT
ncbi:MAG TPA: FGGY family carbohydrate kinase [Anaerolineae bacterium]|nr:FGGY family carbohydrate kinase [Anaerolineae bacterium]